MEKQFRQRCAWISNLAQETVRPVSTGKRHDQEVITSPKAEVEDKSFALYRAYHVLMRRQALTSAAVRKWINYSVKAGSPQLPKRSIREVRGRKNSNTTGNCAATSRQAQAAEIVAAREHPAFWLWSGVKASDELKNAQTVYLHQGEVLVRSGNVVFQRLGLPVNRLTFPSYLVDRALYHTRRTGGDPGAHHTLDATLAGGRKSRHRPAG